jgi:ApaG protein
MSPARYEIRINVETSYVEQHSSPMESRYLFAYTVTISNTGSVPAKLLSRHWVITDAAGKVREVKGEGVVGEQPHLEPGEAFRYTSTAVLETPAGTMQGSYNMLADDGVSFDAPIPVFRLSAPNALH